jgi:hypothetical protein
VDKARVSNDPNPRKYRIEKCDNAKMKKEKKKGKKGKYS